MLEPLARVGLGVAAEDHDARDLVLPASLGPELDRAREVAAELGAPGVGEGSAAPEEAIDEAHGALHSSPALAPFRALHHPRSAKLVRLPAMRGIVLVAGLLGSTLLSTGAWAAPVIAPPGDPAYSASLASLATGYQLQQDTFAALEMGLSLDVDFHEAGIPTAQAFFAQSATTSFQAFSGMQPFSVLESYDEYADIGNFAGIASVGVAARLMALKAEGAPADQIAAARAAAVRAAQAWHVYGAIGGTGIVARGIQRTTPIDAGIGPLPGAVPSLTPLFDSKGNPLPDPKVAVWRAPVASGFDGWIWYDDTSKDQVSGYSLGGAWLWDALVDDPLVDPSIPEGIATDLTAFAKALMKPAPELDGIDLCIRDADGRLTGAHDLNPRQVTPCGVFPASSPIHNGFNAAMALGVILAAWHVGGDPVVGSYYYDELVAKRGYPGMIGNAGIIYLGPATNYSNVNMLAISFALLGRFETDPKLRATYASWVESTLWSAGSAYDASHVEQAWYDVVYGGISAHPTSTIRERVANNLGAFPTPPAFYQDRVNCSGADIEAGSCIGIDGKTVIPLASGTGHDGEVVAQSILPMSIRPYSDFEWRSDPHDVNGTGATNVMDGGDFLAAYWLGRVIDLDDPSKNLTPHPRAPYVAADAGKPDAASSPDAGAAKTPRAPESSGSCGCDVPGSLAAGGPLVAGLASLLAMLAARRRTLRRRGS